MKRTSQAAVRLVVDNAKSRSALREIDFRAARASSCGTRIAGKPIDGQLPTVERGVFRSTATWSNPPSERRISSRSSRGVVSINTDISIKRTNVNPFNGQRKPANSDACFGYDRDMPDAKPKPPGRQSHTPADNRIKKQVGANLIRARKALGFEQDQFAEALGLSQSTLNKYEYGVSFPKPSHFERFMEIGISIQFLFTGLGQPISGPVDVSKLRQAN